jgi:hypothetical protein
MQHLNSPCDGPDTMGLGLLGLGTEEVMASGAPNPENLFHIRQRSQIAAEQGVQEMVKRAAAFLRRAGLHPRPLAIVMLILAMAG